jgi:sulfite dehydrogenase
MKTRHQVLSVCMLLASACAAAVEINLPPDTAAYKPSQLPGYQLVQKNCMTCHSAQYPATQPSSSKRAYWEATVKKMKKAMVDYLVKTYGNERQGQAQAPAAKPGG